MDAARRLEKMKEEDLEKKRKAEEKRKEKQKKSVKSSGGKCQACGLKKCKKTCLFYK